MAAMMQQEKIKPGLLARYEPAPGQHDHPDRWGCSPGNPDCA